MKHWKKLFVCLVISTGSYAQSVTYKVIKDQPDDCANYWVNLGILDMDMAFKNNISLKLGISVNSVVQFKNKVGGEFTFRPWYFTLTEERGRNFELGGFYNLASKSKLRQQKVVLSSKSKYVGGKTYTETISMKVPGTIMRSFGARAGLYSYKTPLRGEDFEEGQVFTGTGVSKNMGLYAGILITGQVNLKTHTSEYGIRGTGFVRRTFIDVMFTPVRSVSDLSGNEIAAAKPGAIGWRFGVEFMQPEPRKVQGNAIYQKFEIGSRPIDGYYLMYSLGFNFKRKVKAMSSFVPVREME